MITDSQAAHKTDEELVILTLQDQNYFLYLIRRYEAKLLRYIFRISSFTKEEAEDVLQEIFIKVYTNLNNFDPDLKFSSWIYRITHNQVISHYRQHKSRLQEVSLDINENFITTITDDLDLNKEIDQLYLKEHLQEGLYKLPLKYREVLILKYLEDKSYQEISDIIKKPTGTVATLINRAKKSFINEIKNHNIKLK